MCFTSAHSNPNNLERDKCNEGMARRLVGGLMRCMGCCFLHYLRCRFAFKLEESHSDVYAFPCRTLKKGQMGSSDSPKLPAADANLPASKHAVLSATKTVSFRMNINELALWFSYTPFFPLIRGSILALNILRNSIQK